MLSPRFVKNPGRSLHKLDSSKINHLRIQLCKSYIYKVNPEGKVSELTTLAAGSMPNGITMDRQGNLVYCDLGKKAMMRVTQSGQVSMIADRAGTLALTLPNFASYDAEGNLYVSNSSTRDVKTVREE